MTNLLLNGILKPATGVVLFLGFGAPFVYYGFQGIHIHGFKDNQRASTIEVTRSHFWVAVNNQDKLVGAKEAVLLERRSGFLGGGRRVALTVPAVSNESKNMKILAGASSSDNELKRRIVKDLNLFLQDDGVEDFERRFVVRNIFGWFGLPFFLLGMWCIIAWT